MLYRLCTTSYRRIGSIEHTFGINPLDTDPTQTADRGK